MLSLHPTIKSRDWMLSRMIAFIWRLVETRVKDDVWVWGTEPSKEKDNDKRWLKFGPSDIDGYYRCDVTSRPLVDQMVISRGNFAAQMVRAQLMSRMHAIEWGLGIENPEAMLDAIEVDKILAQGPLHDLMVQQALKEAHVLPPTKVAPQPEQPVPQGGNGTMNPPGGVGGGPGGPGQGMPLVQPTPTPQGATANQIAQQAGLSPPGGRPAGGDRLGPNIAPRPIVPGIG